MLRYPEDGRLYEVVITVTEVGPADGPNDYSLMGYLIEGGPGSSGKLLEHSGWLGLLDAEIEDREVRMLVDGRPLALARHRIPVHGEYRRTGRQLGRIPLGLEFEPLDDGFNDRAGDFLREEGISGRILHELSVARTIRIDVVLRRVPENCFMNVVVTGGRGAGTYSGHVAVLGDNPTGVSMEYIEGLMGGMQQMIAANMPEDLKAAYEAAMAAQGVGDQATEVAQDPGDAAADLIEGYDPLAELRDMWTLTLEDVRFDDPASSGLGGLAKMAGHFVLSAQLSGAPDPHQGPTQPGQPPLPVSVGVESVGVKGPGLGLAGTNSPKCEVPAPVLTLRPCPGDQWQELDQMGAICGTLEATVCHESGDRLKVEAEFLAGRTLNQCMR